jgi:hypothetical protein
MHSSHNYVAALAAGYLSRILQQQDTLHRHAARISRQDFNCLNELFESTRRIALDAPIFGFDDIGAVAQELHDVVASFSAAPCRFGIDRLCALLLEFDDAVHDASEQMRPTLAPRRPLRLMVPQEQMVA